MYNLELKNNTNYKRLKYIIITASVNKSFIRIYVHNNKYMYISINIFAVYIFKVACTSGPIFEKNMKRYPLFSLQIINYQIDLMQK